MVAPAGAPSMAEAVGERVAKYNRLLEIAAAVPDLRYGTP
jgi:enolase